eukprot:scaffold34822_cov32-Tisochrysis_lutea.AAC.3
MRKHSGSWRSHMWQCDGSCWCTLPNLQLAAGVTCLEISVRLYTVAIQSRTAVQVLRRHLAWRTASHGRNNFERRMDSSLMVIGNTDALGVDI